MGRVWVLVLANGEYLLYLLGKTELKDPERSRGLYYPDALHGTAVVPGGSI